MRWILRIAGIVVVAILAGLAGLLLLPGDQIARIAADQLRAQTGREVTIAGDVRLTLWPVLGVETGPVTLGNADWGAAEPMLRANSLSVGVGAAELLRGDIRIHKIVADAPVLRLETGPDGRGNWQFGVAEPPAGAADTAGTGTVRPFTLERLAFRDASLVYAPHGGDTVRLSDLDLTLSWPDREGAADLRATIRPAGAAVEIVARVEQFDRFLAGEVAPVRAQMQTGGGDISFAGRASSAGEAAGQLDIDAQDSARLLAALGVAGVQLPEGLGRAADISAALTFTRDGRLSLRDLTLQLDRNRLTGAADIVLAGARPRFTVQLGAGALEFPALSGSETGTGAGSESGGWSRTPIDAGALGLADGSLSLNAERIAMDGTTFAPVRVQVTLDRARAVMRLVDVGAWGGRLGGELVANNRSGLSAGGAVTATAIALEPALRDLAGIGRFSGPLSGRMSFLAVGQSVDALMHSLSGDWEVEVGRGVIAGFDLDRLMRSGQATGGTTVFDSLTASFSMSGGELVNDDLLLTLPVAIARGQGRIGLGARDIDYLFTPGLLRGEGEQVLEIPVRITGPWADPRIRPDLEGAAKARLDAEREVLEDRARDKVEEKLREELGITVEEGQDTEDAVKDALEDEAKRQLLKLLGRD